VDYKTVRPSQTLLDPQNPRLPDGTSNDREAINRLLAEGYNQILALARDLVERGEGNPTELPIVVKDGSKYVVLEGNRRFAVLKLLADPKLADEEVHQAAFERIKRKSGLHPPKSLYCAVAKDRDEADPWLTLRHTGANDGVGVRVWSAEQNARHRRRMKAPIDSGTVRSIAIADELTEAYQADQGLVDLIKKVRSSKLTNIGRLFSGVTLTRMQFVMKRVSEGGTQTLWAKHTADQLRPYFLWAFKYLDDNSVDAFKNDELRGNLLNDNAVVLPAPSESMADHKRLADHPYSPEGSGGDGASDQSDQTGGDASGTSNGDGSTSSSSIDGDESSGDTNDPGDQQGGNSGGKRDAKPEKFLYSTVKLPHLSSNSQRLLREAKALTIDDNYAVACVLSRVILELAVSVPKVLAWSGKAENDTLNKKIRACILKLDPLIDNPTKRTRQELEQAFLEVETIGIRYLHQFMHNSATKADPHLARRFSAAFTPLLNSINEAVA
jgi:hypothetical protein